MGGSPNAWLATTQWHLGMRRLETLARRCRRWLRYLRIQARVGSTPVVVSHAFVEDSPQRLFWTRISGASEVVASVVTSNRPTGLTQDKDLFYRAGCYLGKVTRRVEEVSRALPESRESFALTIGPAGHWPASEPPARRSADGGQGSLAPVGGGANLGESKGGQRRVRQDSFRSGNGSHADDITQVSAGDQA
jgi:hypothetical protein